MIAIVGSHSFDGGCNKAANKVTQQRAALPFLRGLRGEELPDQDGRIAGILFREEVATLYRLPLRSRSPLPPNP